MIENKPKSNKSILVFQSIVLLLCWLEVLIFWKKIPLQLPWFYSLPWGEDQLMKKVGLILVLGVATALSLFTSFIASWTKKGDVIIEKTIFIVLLLASLLLLLNLTRVLMIFVI